MTNKEKYENTLTDMFCIGHTFGVDEDGKPFDCSDSEFCRGCIFSKDIRNSCYKKRNDWLKSEYQEFNNGVTNMKDYTAGYKDGFKNGNVDALNGLVNPLLEFKRNSDVIDISTVIKMISVRKNEILSK